MRTQLIPRPLTIDAEFVAEWSGRYRSRAENLRWRPGPGLRKLMATYQDLAVLGDITNEWDLELHVFDVVGTAVRSADEYSLSQFLTVGYWKTPRPLARYVDNVDVPTVTRAALDSQAPADGRCHRLATLSGVGPPVASALLSVWRPDEYTITDVWAIQTLVNSDEIAGDATFGSRRASWWASRYKEYLEVCVNIAQRVMPFTLRHVDRALWMWGQINANLDESVAVRA